MRPWRPHSLPTPLGSWDIAVGGGEGGKENKKVERRRRRRRWKRRRKRRWVRTGTGTGTGKAHGWSLSLSFSPSFSSFLSLSSARDGNEPDSSQGARKLCMIFLFDSHHRSWSSEGQRKGGQLDSIRSRTLLRARSTHYTPSSLFCQAQQTLPPLPSPPSLRRQDRTVPQS